MVNEFAARGITGIELKGDLQVCHGSGVDPFRGTRRRDGLRRGLRPHLFADYPRKCVAVRGKFFLVWFGADPGDSHLSRAAGFYGEYGRRRCGVALGRRGFGGHGCFRGARRGGKPGDRGCCLSGPLAIRATMESLFAVPPRERLAMLVALGKPL